MARECYGKARQPALELQFPEQELADIVQMWEAEWRGVVKGSDTAAWFEEVAKESTEYRYADHTCEQLWSSVQEEALVGSPVGQLQDPAVGSWIEGKVQAWDGMGAWRVGFGDVSKEVEADALEMLLLLPRDRHSLRRTSAYEAAREPPRFDPDAFPAGDNVCRLSDKARFRTGHSREETPRALSAPAVASSPLWLRRRAPARAWQPHHPAMKLGCAQRPR